MAPRRYSGRRVSLRTARIQFAEALRKGGNTVLTEVRLALPGPPPVVARVDILFRTSAGLLFAIDVKTGDESDFTPNQKIVYPHLVVGGLVASIDPRTSLLGLAPDTPLPPIEVVELYTPGPSLPPTMIPFWEYLKKK